MAELERRARSTRARERRLEASARDLPSSDLALGGCPMRNVEVARGGTGVVWPVAGAALAAAIGLTAVTDPKIALAATVALIFGAAILVEPSLLLPGLVASVFVEVLSVGGISISRLLAPIALFVVLAESMRPDSRIRGESPFVWATLYGIWALASGLWTVSISGTTFLLSSLAIGFIYTLAFASLVTSRRELERVLYAFAAAALGIGLFAIAAFLLGFSKGLVAGRAPARGRPRDGSPQALVARRSRRHGGRRHRLRSDVRVARWFAHTCCYRHRDGRLAGTYLLRHAESEEGSARGVCGRRCDRFQRLCRLGCATTEGHLRRRKYERNSARIGAAGDLGGRLDVDKTAAVRRPRLRSVPQRIRQPARADAGNQLPTLRGSASGGPQCVSRIAGRTRDPRTRSVPRAVDVDRVGATSCRERCPRRRGGFYRARGERTAAQLARLVDRLGLRVVRDLSRALDHARPHACAPAAH